jgi:very-short-patch-repair endonuclease
VFDLVVAAGFVEPLVNARYPGSSFIPDLWWRDQHLIVEVDSKEFHDAPLDQRDDLDRQAWLEARGERVLRTTKQQVRRDPETFFARLRAAGAPYTRSAQTQL